MGRRTSPFATGRPCSTASGPHALVIVTEQGPFRALGFPRLKRVMVSLTSFMRAWGAWERGMARQAPDRKLWRSCVLARRRCAVEKAWKIVFAFSIRYVKLALGQAKSTVLSQRIFNGVG